MRATCRSAATGRPDWAVPLCRKPGYQSMPDAAPDSPSSSGSGSGASAPYGIVGGRRRAGDPLAFTSSRVSCGTGCLVAWHLLLSCFRYGVVNDRLCSKFGA